MTDNERDAEAQRALRNLRGLVDAPSEWRAEYRRDWEIVAAALSAATTDRDEARGLPNCGIQTAGGFRIGCGQPITSVGELYRCATCDTAMHKGCLHAHFNYQDEIPPTPSNIERVALAEQRAEALSAQLQQAREALRQIADGEFVTRETGRGRSLVDGVDTEVVYVRDVGVREIARAALAAAAPATTLNEPEGET